MKSRNIIIIAAAIVVVLFAATCVRIFLNAGKAGIAMGSAGYGALFLMFLVALAAVALAFIWRNKPALASARRDNKVLQEEIINLKKTVKELDRELAEKTGSRLNVVGLNPIMHIAVLNVDTSFVRPYVREEGNLTFNGALRADLKVEYGIRLEEVRFKYDALGNNLLLANFHPGIISYSRKQLNWEFAKSYKSRNLFGHDFSDVSDHDAEAFTNGMCEKLRSELEQEIDTRKVDEFEWLSPLITDQVVDVLRLMVGRDSLNVTIVDELEGNTDGFVTIQQLRGQLEIYAGTDGKVPYQEIGQGTTNGNSSD